MNKLMRTFLSLGALLMLVGLYSPEAKAQGRAVSLQVFYDELAPYGDWVEHPSYGYAWRPNAGPDFRPYYTNGRWVMTEYGNTWVSDYDWGWAPFHYGRWYFDDYDGWIWVPDTTWGPAWVDWRSGGGYYGWAPLSPGFSININIGPRYYPNNYWVFIPQRCFYYPNYQSYWYPSRNVTIIRQTTIINNVYVDRGNRNVRYYSGPRADDIRRATRQRVPVYRVADTDRPSSARVERGTVNVYRPSVDRGSNSAPRVVANNSSRPSRAENSGRSTAPSRSNGISERPDRGNVNTNRGSSVLDRSKTTSSGNSRPERSESSSRPQTAPSREVSRPSSSSAPQKVERPAPPTRSQAPAPAQRSSAPSRSERPSPPARAERPSTPSRVERSAPAPRAERSSSPSRGSSSNGNSGRSSGGRPSR